MPGNISCLLLGVVAGLTMLVSPCQAQTTVDNTDNLSNNDVLNASQPNEGIADINNSAQKSVTPSTEVSQASGETAAPAPNRRIPIPSRIFPALQQ